MVLESLEERLVLSAFVVTDNGDSATDSGSLRYAITQVNAGTDTSNTITIDSTLSGGQTITLRSALPQITKNVSIVGPGASTVSVSGNKQYRVFDIASGTTVAISGLTVRDGSAQNGGGILNAGTLTVTHCEIGGNAAVFISGPGQATGSASGGGISNSGVLAVIDSTVSGNSATATAGASNSSVSSFGGAIYSNSGGVVTVTGSTFDNNDAWSDGAGKGSSAPFANTVGSGYGGAIDADGALTITGSTFLGDEVYGVGTSGGISGGGTICSTLPDGLSVADCNIMASRAFSSGPDNGPGGITTKSAGGSIFASGALTISGTSIIGSQTRSSSLCMGGGVFAGGALTVTDCTISDGDVFVVAYGNSTGTATGGGIQAGGAVTVTGSTIAGNQAISDTQGENSSVSAAGGGIEGASTVTVTGSTISKNNAAGMGSPNGQLYGSGTGGGIDAVGQVSLTASTVSNNTAFGSEISPGATNGSGIGGGIATQGTVGLYESTVAGNTAAGSVGGNDAGTGGGIFARGAVSLTDSRIGGNTASASGGGIFTKGPVSLTNTTIDGNTSSTSGGGIFTMSLASLTNCTIAYNAATVSGGGIGTYVPPTSTSGGANGALTTGNSIIGRNTAPAGPDVSSLLPVVSKGHNLIGVTDGSAGWVASDLTGTSAHPFDPVLVLFPSINGGPTWTVALDPGSPAMESGDNALAVDPSGNPLANDQRGPGYPRIVNGTVDIGAFEYQTNTRTVLTSSSPSSAYGGQVTFTITVTEGGAPVTAGDVTIMNGNNELVASLALDASGRASFSTSSLRVSPVPYVIRALYNGAAAAQPSSATLRQTITPAPLTVRAVAQSKIYDGTTGATVALSDNRLPGDQLTVTAVLAAFTDPNAGAGKTVVVSGITLSGPAAANYSLVSPTATTTADIFKANQTIVWSNPATVGSGTPLGPVQLNAKVLGVPGGSAPGALTYSPPAGTVLPPGKNETLTVTAAATINYNSATATVDIKVQSLVQEAAALTRQVQAVASTGAIGHCQADELTDKLRLSGRPRDLGQVVGFIQDVGSLAGRGALGRRTAKALVSGADTLLTGLRAAFRRRTGH